MALTPEEVARLAGLARLELSEDELVQLAPELEVILAAVQQVSDVVDETIPLMTHAMPMSNVMRADAVHTSLSQDEALSSAPASEDGRFRVPQILSED